MSLHIFNKHFHCHSDEYQLGAVTLRVWMDRDTGKYDLSWSVCSPSDNFSKKIGSDIAESNREKGIFVTGQRDTTLPIEMDLINTLSEGKIIASSPEAERYRDLAESQINFVCMAESLMEMTQTLENQRISENPLYQHDRNYYIDQFMSFMPFFTAGLPLR